MKNKKKIQIDESIKEYLKDYRELENRVARIKRIRIKKKIKKTVSRILFL